jgi:hypothetical protein
MFTLKLISLFSLKSINKLQPLFNEVHMSYPICWFKPNKKPTQADMDDYLDCIRVGWRDFSAPSDASCPAGFRLPQRPAPALPASADDYSRVLACLSARDTETSGWSPATRILYAGDDVGLVAVSAIMAVHTPCYPAAEACSHGSSEGSQKAPPPCNDQSKLHICVRDQGRPGKPLRPAFKYLSDRQLL